MSSGSAEQGAARTTYAYQDQPKLVKALTDRTASNSAGYLLPHIAGRTDLRILDVGCGPGSITIDLAQSFVPHGSVTGVDVDGSIVEKAKASAAEQGVSNVQFQTGSIHALDFPDGSFDVVHCHQVLSHAGNQAKAIQEMRRVAKKSGGIVAIRECDVSSRIWYPDYPVFEDWGVMAHRLTRASGGEPDAGRRLLFWALEAGFKREEIDCSSSSWWYSTTEERAWWGAQMLGLCRSPVFSDKLIDAGFATQEKLNEIAVALEEWVKGENACFGVMHCEIICRA